jgi:hypothetical protein
LSFPELKVLKLSYGTYLKNAKIVTERMLLGALTLKSSLSALFNFVTYNSEGSGFSFIFLAFIIPFRCLHLKESPSFL